MLPRTLLALPAALLLGTTLAAQSPCGPLAAEITPLPTDPDWWSVNLYGVTEVPGGGAVAVGTYKVEIAPFDFIDLSLAYHWDGSAWHQKPTQNPEPFPGGAKVRFHAVDALAPDDIWAGGARYGDAGGLSAGDWVMVQHWDGSSWELVDVPVPPGGSGINFSGNKVMAVEAFASDDVWFGGFWGEPNQLGSVTWRPLAMHWDGSEMTVHDTPAPTDGHYGFQSVSFAALAADDLYAACRLITSIGASQQTVLLHYDGSSWSQVDVPDSSVLHRTQEVVALASDDLWLFGSTYPDNDGWALHYDGSSWTELIGATPRTRAAMSLGGDTLVVGEMSLTTFDGTSSTVIDPLDGYSNVSVWGMAAGGACEGWAVGRAVPPGELGLDAFAVRLTAAGSSGPWADMGQALVGSHGLPHMQGAGELVGGQTVELFLDSALEDAALTLVLGLGELSVPFKGGVLVPDPDVVVSGLLTDGSGAWSLAASWPVGLPGGADVYVQAWIQDPSGAAGFAASNALHAATR